MNPITWTDGASDQLVEIFVRVPADERAAVITAVADADTDLRDHATEKGESRGGRERVAFYGRLTVLFFPPDGPTPTEVVMVRWRADRAT